MKSNGMFNRYKYIDDYVVREELDDKGRKVKKVYYNAEYYVSDWTDLQVRRFKILTGLGSVICLALSMLPLSVKHDAMFISYVILVFVAAMIMDILMIGSVLQLPKKAEPMERYRKVLGFDKFGVRAGICCGLAALAGIMNTVFVLFIKNGAPEYPGMDAVVSLCGFAGALISFLLLKKIKTANVHRSDKESEWERICRELQEEENREMAKDLPPLQ